MTPEDFEHIARRILDRVERDQTLHLSSITEEIRLGWLEWMDRDTIKPIIIGKPIVVGKHYVAECPDGTIVASDDLLLGQIGATTFRWKGMPPVPVSVPSSSRPATD